VCRAASCHGASIRLKPASQEHREGYSGIGPCRRQRQYRKIVVLRFAGPLPTQNWVALMTGRPRLAFRQIAGICPRMPLETPCACSTLRRATRAVTAMYDAALAPSGLRITQFSVLVVLGRLGPLPVTRLAAEVALDRSTMGRNLDPLERRGLVRIKVGDVDQRERVAHLTAAGERAIEAARPYWRAAQERIATLVPPSAIRSLADQLDALRPT